MKTRNLLIAALLLGGMTAFNSCSEKTEVDEIIPPIDNPAEELDTYLAFTAGFGDKPMTRAEDSDTRDHEYEDIMNYGEFIFEADAEGTPTKYLAHYINEGEGGKPIFLDKKANGFDLQPLKFKTASKQIAIVVVANSDKLSGITGAITDFNTFSNLLNEVTLPSSEDGFTKYPMSSNVLTCLIEPGKYNSIGFESKSDAISAFENYDVSVSSENNIELAQTNSIYLYRCWSIVKLNAVTVDIYDAKATNARFDLEAAFVMNVPSKTKLFNTEKPTKWSSWGGALNIDLDKCEFYSGNDLDKGNKDHSGNYMPSTAYDEGYRSEAIAEATSFYENYNTTLESAETVVKNEFETYAKKLNYEESENFKYIVAPSAYGRNTDGALISDQSIVLVLKGKYSQQFGDIWYGTGNKVEIQSSYYTVIINNNEADASGLSTNNIPYTVMRNVQYEIDMLVKGPGSPTPVVHLDNSYLVSKVKIVPFGKVKQSSSKD